MNKIEKTKIKTIDPNDIVEDVEIKSYLFIDPRENDNRCYAGVTELPLDKKLKNLMYSTNPKQEQRKAEWFNELKELSLKPIGAFLEYYPAGRLELVARYEVQAMEQRAIDIGRAYFESLNIYNAYEYKRNNGKLDMVVCWTQGVRIGIEESSYAWGERFCLENNLPFVDRQSGDCAEIASEIRHIMNGRSHPYKNSNKYPFLNGLQFATIKEVAEKNPKLLSENNIMPTKARLF